MIRPEDRPEFLNSIAASVTVRPYMRDDGEPVDFSPIAGKRATELGGVVLSNGEDAAAIFEITSPGVYQSHTMFGDTCRGRRAIDTGRDMVAWMFEHGASVVWGATPRENRKARWFNRQIGARVVGGDDEVELFEIRKAN